MYKAETTAHNLNINPLEVTLKWVSKTPSSSSS
jgi:hypothetical protein